MSILDKMYLNVQLRAGMMKEKVKEFMTEERGVSNVAATVILILIVVLLIGIFWDWIKEWLGNMMDTIEGQSNFTK